MQVQSLAAITTKHSGGRIYSPIKQNPGAIDSKSQLGATLGASVRITFNGIARASGISISPEGLIVTARHLIIGLRDKGIFDLHGFQAHFPKPKGASLPKSGVDERASTEEYCSYPLILASEVPQRKDPSHDIVIFKLPESSEPYPSAEITTDRPEKREDVYSIGYPQGEVKVALGEVLDPDFREAYTTAKQGQKKQEGGFFWLVKKFMDEITFRVGEENIGTIITTNEIDSGNSGGGLFNSKGKLCGITTSTIDNFIVNMRRIFTSTFNIKPVKAPLSGITCSQPVSRLLDELKKIGIIKK